MQVVARGCHPDQLAGGGLPFYATGDPGESVSLNYFRDCSTEFHDIARAERVYRFEFQVAFVVQPLDWKPRLKHLDDVGHRRHPTIDRTGKYAPACELRIVVNVLRW